MTRTLSSSFSSTLAGSTMSVVELYKMSASGMSTFLYTDSGSSILYNSETYLPYPIKRGKISFSTDLKIDQTSITIAKNWGIDNAIVKNVLSGSNIQIVRVNTDLPDTDNLLIFDGEVADITLDELNAVVRCQTLDFLNTELPKREFQVGCNWGLYDEFCTVTLASFLGTTNTLTTISRNNLSSAGFSFGISQYYRGGYVTTSFGNNSGLNRHISDNTGDTVTVVPPFPFDFVVGTTVSIAPGCNHDITDCEDKFNNLINYGGFPYVPSQYVII